MIDNKYPCLINDERITPDLNRIRSGSIHKRMMREFTAYTQVFKPVEECAEFIQSVVKHRHFDGSPRNVIEEFYDVLFSLNYTKEYFFITDDMIEEAMKKREAHCEELLNGK